MRTYNLANRFKGMVQAATPALLADLADALRSERMLEYCSKFVAGSHLSERGQWACEMARFACENLPGFSWEQDEDDDSLSSDHVYDLLIEATTDGPLSNIWLGVTVENQSTADERRAHLKTLAEKGWFTWVSHEPALEQVDFTGWDFIRWIVMGGESGPGARPFDITWPRNVMKWAADNQVDFFLKQLGSKPYWSIPNPFSDPSKSYRDLAFQPHRATWTGTVYTWQSTGKGNDPSEWPEDLRVRQMPNVEVKA